MKEGILLANIFITYHLAAKEDSVSSKIEKEKGAEAKNNNAWTIT